VAKFDSLNIPAVHLTENHPMSRRDMISGRALPLGEAGRPTREAGADAIVRYLAVETSPRYRRTTKSTYCNIYACDYCYLSGVYLPRVWWTAVALDRLAQGDQVPVRYGETVAELNANSLYEWLKDWGPRFGWQQVETEEQVQRAVNEGAVGVICAQRKLLAASGHIAVVVPEQAPAHMAERENGLVRLPLQSQAGAHNFCYSCGLSKWWAGAQFRAFGFFVHA
jgi:hypothetical protein